MSDIFGQDTKFGGAFKANLASMTFSTDANGNGGLGVLVQNIRSSYRQQVSRLWELGVQPTNTYYVVGRSMGEMSLARIVGPQAIAADFVSKFSDACSVDMNFIRINPSPGFCVASGNSAGVSAPRTYSNALITSLDSQMATQDMLIQESISLLFTSLSLN